MPGFLKGKAPVVLVGFHKSYGFKVPKSCCCCGGAGLKCNNTVNRHTWNPTDLCFGRSTPQTRPFPIKTGGPIWVEGIYRNLHVHGWLDSVGQNLWIWKKNQRLITWDPRPPKQIKVFFQFIINPKVRGEHRNDWCRCHHFSQLERWYLGIPFFVPPKLYPPL